jgi:glycine reductase
MIKHRIVHYINQFFGGIGGESAAYATPRVVEGAVGPGMLLEKELGQGSHCYLWR